MSTPVVGECGKHPGFNFVNCPMCESEKVKMAKQFWNNVMTPKPLCLTNWGAVLRCEQFTSKMIRVSDPEAIDAGMYISKDDVKAIFRFKKFIQ